MYFVVYFPAENSFFVVPLVWIDKNLKFQEMVNNIWRKNRKSICYFGSDEEAWVNGKPNTDFIPSFAEPQNGRKYFYVQLVKFFGTYYKKSSAKKEFYKKISVFYIVYI